MMAQKSVRILRFVVAGLAVLALPILFQNCAKALPGETSASASSVLPGLKPKYFIGSSVQTAPLKTISLSWTDIAGTSIEFDLIQDMDIEMRAHGSASWAAGATQTTAAHCGFRFVVDGTPYGNASWGDVIVRVESWTPWTMSRTVSLQPGHHVISLQQSGWPNQDSACSTGAEDYSAARLTIDAH